MIVAAIKRYTPAEYLEREEQADVKSEFIEGDIIPVAGASANHNILTGKFHARLLLALEDLNHAVFMSDMRLWLPLHESYTYPDVMVISGEPQFTDNKQTALTNPCLIVEVLSDSTEGYDKSAKFRLYRSIPEFEEYLLVDQTAYRVEQFTKVESHQWLLTEWIGEDAILRLKSVEIEIALKDLYKRVAFVSPSSEPQPKE
ncbi:MAG: Uma2 family endonuclease [Geitlerinemataceae cyanobacterium]